MSYTVTIFDVISNSTFGIWNSMSLHITVNHLHPYYDYIISVAGSTFVGTGPSLTHKIQTLQAGKIRYLQYCN